MKEGLSEDVVYIDLLEGKGLLASFGDITLLLKAITIPDDSFVMLSLKKKVSLL